MKGLILCGGRGTRLRPYSFARPKHLLPIGNRPVVHYMLEQLATAGIHEIGMVIPPHFADQFHSSFGSRYLGADITYVLQKEAKGLAHAVLQAKDWVGNDPFVLCLGDNFISTGASDLIRRFRNESLDGLLYVSQVEDPSRFGVVSLEGNRVVHVVEKPAKPPSSYAMIGVYVLQPAIFDAIAHISPSNRGEYELTDALERMITRGANVSFQLCTGWWADAGMPKDLLACNRNVLEAVQETVHGEGADVRSSQLHGPVVLEDGAVVSGSEITGPAVIGRGSQVIGSHIGPYTSISHGVHVADSTIAGSIVMEEGHIAGLHLVDSLIGGHVHLEGNDRHPIRLYAGDYAQLFM